MIYRDWDKASSKTSYKRRWEASQRALSRALRENRVRDECLTLAIETLEMYIEGSTDGIPAQGTLADIEARLAELEATSRGDASEASETGGGHLQCLAPQRMARGRS